MKISMNYLLRTMLRWAWLALLAGAVLAGGFYAVKGRGAAASERAAAETAVPAEIDPETDAQLARFSLYQPDFDGWKDVESHFFGINEYAASVASFAAARFQTDVSYWHCYEAVLQKYPGLDYRLFTSDVMRNMMKIWQYNYDVVLKVTAPEITPDQVARYAEALGLNASDGADPAAQLQQIQCTLRDAVWDIMREYMADPESLADAEITLRTAPASYEEMMALQSVVSAEPAFAVKEGVLNQESGHVGKKTLALLFLIGAALVEAVVMLIVLFDPRVKDASDLTANTDLSILQQIPDDASALTETALCLSGRAPVLLGVGLEEAKLSGLSGRMDEAMKTLHGADAGRSLPVAAGEADLSWLAALQDRPVVLAVQELKTTYDALRATSRHLEHVRADVRGALLLEKERKQTKG